jgi:hypothetical protein
MHFVRQCRLNARSALWWWGCCARVGPGYDEGLSPFQADGLQKRASGSEWRLFFNAALFHHSFHGSLSAAAVHVRGGAANPLW